MHGYGKEYLDLFTLMQQKNITRNEVTFISILKASSVAGHVEEGLEAF